jgi:predicted transcriptional regulator
MAKAESISDAELEVLKLLWEQGPSTVREVHAQLAGEGPRRAYTTVLTLLVRLREKGFVASEKSGVALAFRAVVSREQLLQRRLAELADQVCDGTAAPLVHALVDSRRFSAEDIKAFRRLLDELDPDRRK